MGIIQWPQIKSLIDNSQLDEQTRANVELTVSQWFFSEYMPIAMVPSNTNGVQPLSGFQARLVSEKLAIELSGYSTHQNLEGLRRLYGDVLGLSDQIHGQIFPLRIVPGYSPYRYVPKQVLPVSEEIKNLSLWLRANQQSFTGYLQQFSYPQDIIFYLSHWEREAFLPLGRVRQMSALLCKALLSKLLTLVKLGQLAYVQAEYIYLCEIVYCQFDEELTVLLTRRIAQGDARVNVSADHTEYFRQFSAQQVLETPSSSASATNATTPSDQDNPERKPRHKRKKPLKLQAKKTKPVPYEEGVPLHNDELEPVLVQSIRQTPPLVPTNEPQDHDAAPEVEELTPKPKEPVQETNEPQHSGVASSEVEELRPESKVLTDVMAPDTSESPSVLRRRSRRRGRRTASMTIDTHGELPAEGPSNESVENEEKAQETEVPAESPIEPRSELLGWCLESLRHMPSRLWQSLVAKWVVSWQWVASFKQKRRPQHPLGRRRVLVPSTRTARKLATFFSADLFEQIDSEFLMKPEIPPQTLAQYFLLYIQLNHRKPRFRRSSAESQYEQIINQFPVTNYKDTESLTQVLTFLKELTRADESCLEMFFLEFWPKIESCSQIQDKVEFKLKLIALMLNVLETEAADYREKIDLLLLSKELRIRHADEDVIDVFRSNTREFVLHALLRENISPRITWAHWVQDFSTRFSLASPDLRHHKSVARALVFLEVMGDMQPEQNPARHYHNVLFPLWPQLVRSLTAPMARKELIVLLWRWSPTVEGAALVEKIVEHHRPPGKMEWLGETIIAMGSLGYQMSTPAVLIGTGQCLAPSFEGNKELLAATLNWLFAWMIFGSFTMLAAQRTLDTHAQRRFSNGLIFASPVFVLANTYLKQVPWAELTIPEFGILSHYEAVVTTVLKSIASSLVLYIGILFANQAKKELDETKASKAFPLASRTAYGEFPNRIYLVERAARMVLCSSAAMLLLFPQLFFPELTSRALAATVEAMVLMPMGFLLRWQLNSRSAFQALADERKFRRMLAVLLGVLEFFEILSFQTRPTCTQTNEMSLQLAFLTGAVAYQSLHTGFALFNHWHENIQLSESQGAGHDWGLYGSVAAILVFSQELYSDNTLSLCSRLLLTGLVSLVANGLDRLLHNKVGWSEVWRPSVANGKLQA